MRVSEPSTLPLWANRLILSIRVVSYGVLASAGLYGVFSLVGFGFSLSPSMQLQNIVMPVVMVFVALNRILFGLAALGIAQLLFFLLDDKRRPGVLLRYADKGLYLWAGVGLVSSAISLYADVARIESVIKFDYLVYWAIGLGIVTALAQALVMIIIGLVLHRVLPIIEESRALV